MTEEQLEILADHTLRIESILSIGGMGVGGDLAGELEEYIETEQVEDLEETLPEVPSWLRPAARMERDTFPATLVGWLISRGHAGLLVQYARPCMRHSSSGGSSYSWGSYNTKWFYGETIEDTLDKATVWAEERKRAELTKQSVTAPKN
jgi:hypothetical protein